MSDINTAKIFAKSYSREQGYHDVGDFVGENAIAELMVKFASFVVTNKKNSFHNLTEEELTRVIGKAYCDGYYKCHFNGPLKELETLPARQYAEEVIKIISKKKAEQLKSRDSG